MSHTHIHDTLTRTLCQAKQMADEDQQPAIFHMACKNSRANSLLHPLPSIVSSRLPVASQHNNHGGWPLQFSGHPSSSDHVTRTPRRLRLMRADRLHNSSRPLACSPPLLTSCSACCPHDVIVVSACTGGEVCQVRLLSTGVVVYRQKLVSRRCV